MAADTTDLVSLARAADANVTGGAVLESDRAAEPNWHVVERADGVRVRLDTANGNAPTQAAIDAVASADLSEGAVAARAQVRLRALASAAFAAIEEGAARDRGIVLVAVDEINLLRQWLTTFKAEVAAATSLADLKTRVAGLPNLPDRTPVQAKNAVTSKINAGGAD